MEYRSTRDSSVRISAAQAIAQGISRDGGLFVPESFPSVSAAEIAELCKTDYRGRAARILSPYLTEFSKDEIDGCVSSTYAEERFSCGNPAPVVTFGGISFLELWHGPTCAFKDMALQLLPRLLTISLRKIHSEKEAMILVATSGDTGKAALEGFKDVKGTRILVFYPKDGVSEMQRRQMCTQEGSNVAVVAVNGNFDDAQTGVKKIFTDCGIVGKLGESGLMFSSANSINWGRLVPQIVYYFSAWCDLVSSGAVHEDEEVNFCVPTGNFGDILAAYYAKKMGLPIHRLICASNANNVLTEFLTTGVYNRNRKFFTTISPSMDILVSSNLERLLYDLTGNDGAQVAEWMQELRNTGTYKVKDGVMAKIRELFYAGFCSDTETEMEIRDVYRSQKYLCDPHTAVASRVCRKYRAETGDRTHTVVVSTASPYKFAPDVLHAIEASETDCQDVFGAVRRLSEITGTSVPGPIADLESKPVRMTQVCEKDKMGAVVLSMAGLKD